MADEKKPESSGPVVIRKGQVKPLPEVTGAEAPAPAAPAREDSRPLWQRVAQEQGTTHGAPAAPPRGPRPGRPQPQGRGDRGPGRRDRPPRRE
jgi:small subunit ribosomal protein S1